MKRLLWLLALVLLLATAFAFLIQDLVGEELAVELLRLYWAARLTVESLPQVLIWLAFLVFALVAAVASLSLPGLLPREVERPRSKTPGRVQVLARWIQRATEGEYYRWRLAQHLGAVAREVITYRERVDPQDLAEALRSGRLDLPPNIQDYLYARPNYSARTAMSLRSWLGQWLGRAAGPPRPDLGLESVVRFLEEEMEVEHESRTR